MLTYNCTSVFKSGKKDIDENSFLSLNEIVLLLVPLNKKKVHKLVIP